MFSTYTTLSNSCVRMHVHVSRCVCGGWRTTWGVGSLLPPNSGCQSWWQSPFTHGASLLGLDTDMFTVSIWDGVSHWYSDPTKCMQNHVRTQRTHVAQVPDGSCPSTNRLLMDLELAPRITCSTNPGSEAKMWQSAVSRSPGDSEAASGKLNASHHLWRQMCQCREAAPSLRQYPLIPERQGFLSLGPQSWQSTVLNPAFLHARIYWIHQLEG